MTIVKKAAKKKQTSKKQAVESMKKPPWKKKNPKKGQKPSKMTPAQIAEARERAKKAGRPYPNLVDNMAVKKKAAAAKKDT